MNDLIINVEKSTRMVLMTKTTVGNDMENLQEKLVFKFTDTFVNGQGRLEYKIGTDKNYIVLTKEDNTYTIPVQNVITKEGKIEMQLVITEGIEEENIPVFKSNVFYLYCNRSLNAVNEAPEGYDLWIDIANEKLNEIDNLDIDITTEDENTKVIITRKDGSTKEVVVSGGGGTIDDVKVNNVSVVSNRIANIDLTSYVQDNNYVHTDNNYTDSEKIKLSNLFNYDDTEIRNTLNNKADKNEIPTKTSDLTNDSGFITGYTETDPTVPSHVKNITQANISSWNNKQNSISDLSTIRSGASAGATAVQPSDLATVATSGSYNDLSNKPSEVTESTVSNWGFTKNTGTYSKPSGGIPSTDLSSAVQTSLGKADTAIQSISSSDVTSALGYTPYNSTNPNGYTSNVGTITGITMNGASKGTSGVVDLGTVITSHQDISGKANKISVVQSSASTIEINPNTFYKFGEVASLNITLASITDNTIYNEYMFEFVSGTTATTLTLPSSIKWLKTPTIDANKIYQCSIVDNVGLLVGVANV